MRKASIHLFLSLLHQYVMFLKQRCPSLCFIGNSQGGRDFCSLTRMYMFMFNIVPSPNPLVPIPPRPNPNPVQPKTQFVPRGLGLTVKSLRPPHHPTPPTQPITLNSNSKKVSGWSGDLSIKQISGGFRQWLFWLQGPLSPTLTSYVWRWAILFTWFR